MSESRKHRPSITSPIILNLSLVGYLSLRVRLNLIPNVLSQSWTLVVLIFWNSLLSGCAWGRLDLVRFSCLVLIFITIYSKKNCFPFSFSIFQFIVIPKNLAHFDTENMWWVSLLTCAIIANEHVFILECCLIIYFKHT